MQDRLRKSGIGLLGDLPWSTHFCQFYQTRDDLKDIIVPFLRAGLEENESCVWVTSEALTTQEALAAMRAHVPDVGTYLSSGQLEILPYAEWYIDGGVFNPRRVVDSWTERLDRAVARGYEGTRVTGDTMWLERKDWKDFMAYESAINEVIEDQKLLVFCTYSLDRCGASEIIDVVTRHESALIRREGEWEIIESQEHKQTSHALRRSEERYRSLFHGMNEGFAVHEIMCDERGKPSDYRFLEANPSFERLTGLSRHYVIGKTIRQVMPDIDEEWIDTCGRVALAGEAVHVEKHISRLSRQYEIFAYCPAPGKFATLFVDITERKGTEEALRKQMERLDIISTTASRLLMTDKPQALVEDLCRRVMEHLDCHVFFNYLVDVERNCLTLNAHAGIPESTAREIRYLDFGAGVCGCAARDSCRIVTEDIPGTPDVRTDLVRSFGITAYACHPLFEQGRVIGTLSFGTKSRLSFADEELLLMKTVADQVAIALVRIRLLRSTEERASELEARVSERTVELKRQADLLDLTHDAIYVRDTEGRIVFWNRAATEMYGWSEAEALGRLGHELLHTEFPVPFAELMAKIVDEGRWEGELRQTTRDRKRLVLASRWTAQRQESGEVVRVLVTNSDVSEQKHVERQFRQSQKMEALGTLTGGIAHDFNNILAAIIGFGEMADERVDDPKVRRSIRRIVDAGLRGRELVKRMLMFSRRMEQEKSPIQLSAIVQDTVKLLRASIPVTIDIGLELESESGVILGVPIEMQQVLMNLCMNAADAMKERGGLLSVTLSDFSVSDRSGTRNGVEPGLYMKLSVRDTGVGIPADHIDKIFDPFFTTKRPGEGTGLGLSVVHGIVNQHGGRINVESEPGKGSTFTVYLPKYREAYVAQGMVDEAMPGGEERILFIDDEEALCETGQAILTRLGYQVTVRSSSKAALALLTHDPSQFDLVITDQTMPEMTGMELARAIMALRPDVPVILSTGFSHLVGADTARQAGISAFALKPLTKGEVARTVRRVLDERKTVATVKL